jgi:hypothetical protein
MEFVKNLAYQRNINSLIFCVKYSCIVVMQVSIMCVHAVHFVPVAQFATSSNNTVSCNACRDVLQYNIILSHRLAKQVLVARDCKVNPSLLVIILRVLIEAVFWFYVFWP